MDALEVLDRRRRCLLAFRGAAGPLVVPAPCWSDGAHLWLTVATGLLAGGDLPGRGRCALLAAGREAGPEEAPAVAASGDARVFGLADPVGLVLHGPALAGALAALGVTSASSVAGYVQETARLPLRVALRDRLVVRVRLDELDLLEAPPQAPGVAPALPPAVPADVRRALGGRRRVAVAVQEPLLEVLPGVLGSGFALTPPPGRSLPAGVRAVVVLEAAAPMEVGLALRGRLDARGALVPERATWWDGGRASSAEVASTPAAGSGIVLPD